MKKNTIFRKAASVLCTLCSVLLLAGCSDADRLTVAPEEMTSEYVTVTAVVPGDIWATASRAEGAPVSGLELATLVYAIDEDGNRYIDETTGKYDYYFDTFSITDDALTFSEDGGKTTVSFVVSDLPWRNVSPDENNQYCFSLSATTAGGDDLSSRLIVDAEDAEGKPLAFPALTPRMAKLTVNVKFDGVSIKPGGVFFAGADTSIPEYGCDVIVRSYYYPNDPYTSDVWEATDHYDYIGRNEWNSNHTIQLFTKCVHDISFEKTDDGNCYTHSYGGGAGQITPQPLTVDTKMLQIRYYDTKENQEVSRYLDLSQVKVRRPANAPTKGDLYDEEGNLFEGDVMTAEQSLFTPNGIYADGTEFGYNCGEHIVLNITVLPQSADISVGSPTGIEIEAFTAADEDDYENDLGGTAKKSNE